MNFSDFLKTLYPFCGTVDKSEFVVTVTNMAISENSEDDNPLGDLKHGYRGKIFNGSKPLTAKHTAFILKNLDKERFASHLDELTNDARTNLGKSLATFGIKTAVDTVADDCADIFECILRGIPIETHAPMLKPPLAKHNLPKKNLYFSGRESVLGKIYDAFEQNREIAVTQSFYGLGGIGKTQIALRYAYSHLAHYEYICWIVAETEAETVSSVRKALWAVFKIEEALHTENDDDVVELFKHCCEQGKGLIVFDNVEMYTVVEKYISNTADIHVMITTRLAHMQEVAIRIDIGVFKPDEASIFIMKRLGKEEIPENSDVLCRRLGYLPLALEQAAAYIVANDRSVTSYLALLAEYAPELLENDDGLVAYNKAVAATLRISIRKIELQNSKNLLNLLAYFAADNIRLDFFEGLHPDTLPTMAMEAFENKLELDKVIRNLTQYSIVKREDCILSLHRLVQETVRKDSGENGKWYIIGCGNIIYQKLKFDYADIESRQYFSQVLPHAEHMLSFLEGIIDEFEEREMRLAFARTFYLIADYYYRSGRYSIGLPYYEKSLKWFKATLGDDHEDVAVIYNEISTAYREAGDYDAAIESSKLALKIREALFGEESEITASTYTGLALAYCSACKFEESLSLQKKAISIFEKTLGVEDPDVAVACNNAGIVCDELGLYDEAIELYKRAIAIYIKAFGDEHPDTADSYGNMANAHISRGEYDKAKVLCKKALNIRAKILGENHPDVATLYNSMGLIELSKGYFEDSLDWYNKALDIQLDTLGEEHPLTATTYNNIAVAYEEMDECEKALIWYGKALKIREKVLESEHAEVIATYNNIGVVYYKEDNLEKAFEYFENVLETRKRLYAPDHTEMAGIYNNIALVYYKKGDFTKAFELLDSAKCIREKNLGESHPDTAMTYANIGMVYLKQENLTEALYWNRKALVGYEKSLGNDNPYTIEVKADIADIEEKLRVATIGDET